MFDGIKKAFQFLYDLLITMFEWILNGIAAIFQPIIDLVIGIGYFIFMIGTVLVEILQLIGAVAKLAIGIVTGLFKTITGLSYSGSPANIPGTFDSVFDQMQPVLQALQFNKIGYVITFSIWVFTAIYAVRIIQTFRGGNDA